MLALETIEAVFRRLSTRYGSTWAAKWAGLPAPDVMADWQRVLTGVPQDALRYALDNLPDFVPTAHQFREICFRAPPRRLPALPRPQPTEEEKARVRTLLAGLKRKLATGKVA